MSLTQQEVSLIQRVAMLGPSALFDEGYDRDAAHDFMSRPDVRAELERLNLEFTHQEVLDALARFGTKRQLVKLAPGSVAVLARGLAGPRYARAADGTILRDVGGKPVLIEPEPTTTQMRAASEVLDRIGVEGRRPNERLPAVNFNILFREQETASVEIELDPELETAEQRALSRERIRTGIELLRNQLPAIRDSESGKVVLSAVSGKKKKAKRKKKKKVAKKKTIKKKTIKKATKTVKQPGGKVSPRIVVAKKTVRKAAKKKTGNA